MMDFPSPKPGTAGSLEHFSFIERTDRRNLHTQLKNLVHLAKEIANKDLNKRREKLRKLLEREDKAFEEEFANSAKARLQSEMQERATRKQDESQKVSQFLKKKRIQQFMNSCYEVRQALREKDREETRICLEEQIVENERKMARQRDLDRYWLRVQQTNLEREDARQRNEDCIKQWRREEVNHVLAAQLEEKEAKLEEERKEKASEVERINNLLKEIRLEELNRDQSDRVQNALKYREELLSMMAAKKKEREEEEAQLCAEHRQLMCEIAFEEAEAKRKYHLAKQQHKKTLLEYIDYVRRMRQLEADAHNMRDDRIEDLRRVDVCTKGNLEAAAKKKAEAAAKCYAELRRQVCEQYERQKREEIERREDKIIENRFAHPDIPREVILAQRRKNCEELDKQIEEIKRVRAEEEARYERQLMKAVCDPEVCRQLAIEYIRDGVDYLEPHPNWLVLLNPCKEYVGKGQKVQPNLGVNVDTLRIPVREPFLPAPTCTPEKSFGPCAKVVCKNESSGDGRHVKPNAALCGCAKRWHSAC